jgi:hypothetical protein
MSSRIYFCALIIVKQSGRNVAVISLRQNYGIKTLQRVAAVLDIETVCKGGKV